MSPLRFVLTATMLVLLGSVRGVQAQAECPAIVATALERVAASCSAAGRNQVCYGNDQLALEARPNAADLVFEQPGDLANLAEMQQLRLSPMSLDDATWGVALMQLQANLPDTLPGQNVTMLLFGDVQLENAAPLELPVTTTTRVRVRWEPNSERNNILFAVDGGQTFIANGRLEDGSWLRILLERDDVEAEAGWVSADFVTAASDLNSLAVVDQTMPTLTPMEAFYFTTGIGDSQCREAPASGLLVQTPQGAATATFTVNSVRVTLNSTAYLQAGNGAMQVSLVEGRALVTAGGASQLVPGGTFTAIPLDADGLASAPPAYPAPYDASVLAALPTSALPRTVSVALALAQEQIEPAIANSPPISGEWLVTSVITGSNGGGCTAQVGDTGTSTSHVTFSEDGSTVNVLGHEYTRTGAEGVYSYSRSLLTGSAQLLNVFAETLTLTSPTSLTVEGSLAVTGDATLPCTTEYSLTAVAY